MSKKRTMSFLYGKNHSRLNLKSLYGIQSKYSAIIRSDKTNDLGKILFIG